MFFGLLDIYFPNLFSRMLQIRKAMNSRIFALSVTCSWASSKKDGKRRVQFKRRRFRWRYLVCVSFVCVLLDKTVFFSRLQDRISWHEQRTGPEKLAPTAFRAWKRSIRKRRRYKVSYYLLLHAYRGFLAMIVVPTRELALQTSQICIELSKHLKIKVSIVYFCANIESHKGLSQ